MYKELLATAAVFLTFAMFVPYIRSIRDGRTKPHAFSWIIWALGTFVVFLAQLADGGGLGAWPIGVSGLVTAYIAVLAYRSRSDTSVTRTDWIFLAVALAALPCWLLTSNPLLAVVLLTGMDLAGFGPTFRFAFSHPHEERIGFYSLGAVRNALAISALEHYSLTTVLFPAAVGVACVVFVMMVGYRRTRLRPQESAVGAMRQRDPPQLLQLVREPINAGDEAAYEEIEDEIAAACVALKCPHPHLALETLSGQKEIWWFNFFESEEERLQVTRAYESNRPLMEVLTRNSERKSRYTGQITDKVSRYRRDLGREVQWDLLGARYAVVTFGDAAIATGGPVFEQPDGAYFAVRLFRDLEDAKRFAGNGANILGFRPSWGLPAQELIDADRDFWSANPVASQRNTGAGWTQLVSGALISIGFAVVVIWSARSYGRTLYFAVGVNWILMAWAIWLGRVLESRSGAWDGLSQRLPAGYYVTRPFETRGRVYDYLGVRWYQRLLRPWLWSTKPALLRSQRGTRQTMIRATRDPEAGHLIIFVVIIGIMFWALVSGWWDTVVWLLLFNLLHNGYPVLSMRQVRARLVRRAEAVRTH